MLAVLNQQAQTQMLVVPLGKGPNAGQEDLPPAGTGIEGKAFVFVSGNDLVIIINGDPVTLYDVANDTEPKLWDDLVPPFGSLGHKNVEEVEVHRLHTPAIYRKEYVDRLIRREVTERQTPLPRRNLAFFNPADEQTVIDALLLSIRNGTEPAFLSAWATRLTARGSHLIEDQSLPLAYCTDTTLPSPSEIDSPYPSFVTRTDVISLSHSPSCIFDLDSLNDLIRTGEITADMRRVDTHITSIGTRCEDKLLIRELATTSQHDEMTRWWKDLRAADPHVRRDSNMTIVGLLAHTPDDVVAFIIHIKSKVLALYYSKDTSLGPFVESVSFYFSLLFHERQADLLVYRPLRIILCHLPQDKSYSGPRAPGRHRMRTRRLGCRSIRHDATCCGHGKSPSGQIIPQHDRIAGRGIRS